MRTFVNRCAPAGLALAAGVVGASLTANAATTMSLQVSPALAETWSSSIAATPGQSIDIRVMVSYTGSASGVGGAAPIGLSSVIFQPTVSNWQLGVGGDVLSPMVAVGHNNSTPSGAVLDMPGQYGRIRPFATVGTTTNSALFGHVHAASAQTGDVSYLRIAQKQVTSWLGGIGNTSGGSGVNIKQFGVNNPARPLGSVPPFNFALTDIVIFKFNIVLSSDSAVRSLAVDAPLQGIYSAFAGFPYVGWYSDPNEETPSIVDLPSIVPALITVPSPAAGVVLLGLCVARRRRAR
jgi:hypothetical protein